MKRSRIVLLVAFATAATAAAVACSFPDVSYENGDGDGGPDSQTSNEGGPMSEGGPDASDAAVDSYTPVDPDGASQEASVYDAASKVDASGCTTCDCDNDTFAREGGVVSSAGVCVGSGDAGYDCDDTIADIKPTAGFVQAAAWPSNNWPVQNDWNCDGVATRQFAVNLDCTSMLVAATSCTALSGFTGNPACGATGPFVTCVNGTGLGALFCAVGTTTTQTQGCR